MKTLKKSNNQNTEPFSSRKGFASSLKPKAFPKTTCVKPQRSIKGMKSVRPPSKSFVKEE